MDLYQILNKLNINYELIEHEAVFTVDDAKRIEDSIEGIGCKNLFLTDNKNNYYLVLIQEDKRLNIKEISKLVNANRLSFASTEQLMNILKLEKGSVTPLGIINDVSNIVTIIIDKDLKENKVLCHPNTNTRTISLEFDDLIRFIEFFNHKYIIF